MFASGRARALKTSTIKHAVNNNILENNTRMCGNVKFISSVSHERAKRTSAWDILFDTRNIFIFPSIHVLFCSLYKKIVLLPHKNDDEKITREIINFISAGKINKKIKNQHRVNSFLIKISLLIFCPTPPQALAASWEVFTCKRE